MKSLEMYGNVLKEADAFVRELDENIRLAAFNFLLTEEAKLDSATGEVLQKSKTAEPNKSLSPQELIYLCGAASLMDKAVVLGYWLEQYQGLDSFTSTDLKNAFSSAREPAPVNPSDVVAKLEASRRLMKAAKTGKAQAYQLTGTAMAEVREWLNSSDRNATGERLPTVV